jgi:hemerythrin superfamily protein
MALADLTSTSDAPLDAIALLTRDHRLVDELFTEVARCAPQQRDPLARRIYKLLRVHSQIEEEIFYPAARRALQDAALIDRAEREHNDAKHSIGRLESMTSDQADFDATLTTLQRQIAAHVREEEEQIFPQVRQGGLDLVALGIALAERRDVLMDVLGLHSDDEDGVANQRDTRQGTRFAQDART